MNHRCKNPNYEIRIMKNYESIWIILMMNKYSVFIQFWAPDGLNGADEYESVSDILLQAVIMKHKDFRLQI